MSKGQFTQERELAADAAKLGVTEKKSFTEQVRELSRGVESGSVNPLDGYIILKTAEAEIKDALQKIRDLAVEESEKYGKSFTYKNATVNVKRNAGRWDFSHITKWIGKRDELKKIEESAKASYQSKGKDLLIVDGDGEVVEAAKYTEGDLSISVSVKKEVDNHDPLDDVF